MNLFVNANCTQISIWISFFNYYFIFIPSEQKKLGTNQPKLKSESPLIGEEDLAPQPFIVKVGSKILGVKH